MSIAFYNGSMPIHSTIFGLLLWVIMALHPLPAQAAESAPVKPPNATGNHQRVEFARPFAPSEGMVPPVEQPYRQEVCLNGVWQFQPVPVPATYQRDTGVPPELPQPSNNWERTPIKIPSPWNVNAWGTGRKTGDPANPYEPGSIYYPSYPPAWTGVEMGWLQHTFRVPQGWTNRRLMLHFEAVAGECQVWVNGQFAGSHFDSYLPFDLDITKLVKRDGSNELRVGVRVHSLFNKQSQRYSKMRAPYPVGSTTERLAGIWQDVFLLGLPAIRITDVFAKPWIDRDTLELQVTVHNDTSRPQQVNVKGQVRPWLNLAAHDILSAPEHRWKLGDTVFSLRATSMTIQPGGEATLTLHQRVNHRLKLWALWSPNLYTAVLTVSSGNRTLDTHATRFGWRQFSIHGQELWLNGKKIQLVGDFLHPFGPFIMSRRYAWAWYRLVQDFGGNCVRLHAQIHPRHYLDLADEMGLVVLDETAIFGSSIALNFEEPVAWQRFDAHYDGLVLRDRNHPSVFGWSFGNELFAIFELNHVTPQDADRWYGQLAALGLRARRLDPTRDWISCDGDEDLRGRLPVWSKHFGHGLPLDRLPNLNKPLMVGESGGTYYARPEQLAVFNGERAYESYAGRNEALGIDVYDNIVHMALPRLAYYSASETAWFGVEHLNYGYHDFHRLPGEQDGVFFTHRFQAGQPGMQPERLPPYVAAVNPGWDASLPLYRPLAMFQAEKAALAKPQPSPWPRSSIASPKTTATTHPVENRPGWNQAEFIGDLKGELGRRLTALGVPLMEPGNAPKQMGTALSTATGILTIVDADTVTDPTPLKHTLDTLQANGGLTLWMLGGGQAHPETWDGLLPASVRLTSHPATALVPNRSLTWTANFTLPELYFAEDGANRFLLQHGLAGKFVEQGQVALRASNTDWSLFNNASEAAKCGAVVLYEHLLKPSGAALVGYPYGKGQIALCTVDYRVRSRAADAFWRKLLTNIGVNLHELQQRLTPAFEQTALLNALSIGRFAGADLDTVLAHDFVGETTIRPTQGTVAGGLTWQPVTSPSRDRFIFEEMNQAGPQETFAVYFSFWIQSPRALDDLLAGGPDVPHLGMLCYAAERCRLLLNGQELRPAGTQPVDYRTLYTFENMPLKQGWNHFLIKVASNHLQGEHPGTLAVHLLSNNEAYLRELDSAVELESNTLAAQATPSENK